MVNGRFDAHSTQHDLTWDTSFLGMDHKILVGLDAFWLDHRDRRTGDLIAPVDVFAPRSDPTVVEAGGQFRNYGFDLKSRLVGFYAQDQVTVLKDQPGVHKLLLLAGGRCHMAQESLRRFGEVFGSPVTDPLTSRTDSAFSPRVGLLYMPTERLSLYGSWSRSFKP